MVKTKTKTLTGVALVTLAVGSLAAGLFTLQKVYNSKNKVSVSCTRTGDVKDIYAKGYVSGINEQKMSYKQEDECTPSPDDPTASSDLIRYTCTTNTSSIPRSKIMMNKVNCPFGCKDGACLKNCEEPMKNCDNKCVNIINDPNNCGQCNTKCSTGICQNGKCTKKIECKNNTVSCLGKCVNTNTNRNNCGSCGKTCSATETCTNGSCVAKPISCTKTGWGVCNNKCVSLNTSINCGACGNVCASGTLCKNGTCVSNTSPIRPL